MAIISRGIYQQQVLRWDENIGNIRFKDSKPLSLHEGLRTTSEDYRLHQGHQKHTTKSSKLRNSFKTRRFRSRLVKNKSYISILNTRCWEATRSTVNVHLTERRTSYLSSQRPLKIGTTCMRWWLKPSRSRISFKHWYHLFNFIVLSSPVVSALSW